jgi:hypothetical protein
MSRWPSQINQRNPKYHPLLHHETIAVDQIESEVAIKVQALAGTVTATNAVRNPVAIAIAALVATANPIIAAPAAIAKAIIAVLPPTA